jgi:hypothetical protein
LIGEPTSEAATVTDNANGPFPWSNSPVRRMNSTPGEFRRALVQAFGDCVSEDESGLLLVNDDTALHFTLTCETPYHVGLLKIALLRVEISVRRGDDVAAKKLQAQVDRATQRGGG